MSQNPIPSIAALALQYGTITQAHYKTILKTHPSNQDRGLLENRFATQYQVDLLVLIQEFLVLKHQDEAFGRMAIERGYASPEQVKAALAHQKKEFKTFRKKKLIGDILVAAKVISPSQQREILTEQRALKDQANHILSPKDSLGEKDPASLSSYEKQFLTTKGLDKEFAAMVLEKQMASEWEVLKAQREQQRAFSQDNTLRRIGDIMVEAQSLTPEERDLILEEQGRLPAQGGPMQISLNPDKTIARVQIQRDELGQVTLDQLKAFLAQNNICKGLCKDSLLQAHLQEPTPEFIVAHTLPRFPRPPAPGEIKKGNAIHWDVPMDAPMTDVHGQPKTQGPQIRGGAGVRTSRTQKGWVANRNGIPCHSLYGKIFVLSKINVLEDADLRYGPLERYSNISVSGILTGAYPVTAGTVAAREIRGCTIDALGNVTSRLGISNAIIRTQGHVKARYIHNSRIEACGSIQVEKEIIDSTLMCTGKIDAPNCTALLSSLHAKNGITLYGVGSHKTAPCVLGAGDEAHTLACFHHIHGRIQKISARLHRFQEKIEDRRARAKKTFQKMVDLKIFHDQTRKKKQGLQAELQKKELPADKQKNGLALVTQLDRRMKKSIATLGHLNKEKNKYQAACTRLEKKINALRPGIENKIANLEQDLVHIYAWLQDQPVNPRIKINGIAFQGNILKGSVATIALETDLQNFTAKEVLDRKTSAPTIQISS